MVVFQILLLFGIFLFFSLVMRTHHFSIQHLQFDIQVHDHDLQNNNIFIAFNSAHYLYLRSFEQYPVGCNEMPFTAWKHTERSRQKKVCYDFMRFRDSCSLSMTAHSILQSLPRYYLKGLSDNNAQTGTMQGLSQEFEIEGATCYID